MLLLFFANTFKYPSKLKKVMDEKILKSFVLQNAVRHDGKAEIGSVIGSLIAVHPEIKQDLKTISKVIQSIIKEVNKIIPEEQKKQLEALAPEMLEIKKKEQRE